MDAQIKIKVNSLKLYLEKDPQEATELALHFYQAYLQLSQEADILINLNEHLIQQQSQQKPKTVSLPPFLNCHRR